MGIRVAERLQFAVIASKILYCQKRNHSFVAVFVPRYGTKWIYSAEVERLKTTLRTANKVT